MQGRNSCIIFERGRISRSLVRTNRLETVNRTKVINNVALLRESLSDFAPVLVVHLFIKLVQHISIVKQMCIQTMHETHEVILGIHIVRRRADFDGDFGAVKIAY